MALWSWNGEQWAKDEWHKKDLGVPVFLCCPGPSLADVHERILNGPGRIIAALNRAYPKVRPDIWIGMDRPACHDRKLWWEPFAKVTRGGMKREVCLGYPIRECPNTHFADLENKTGYMDIFKRLEPDVKFVWPRNTFTTALHILLWMGARKVFLVGCDFGGYQNYHDGSSLPRPLREGNKRLYASLARDMAHIAVDARMNGVTFISCTPDSPINGFLPYVPLGRALEEIDKAVPSDCMAPLLHSMQAEKCVWHNTPKPGRQVIVMADHRASWMLPWWWHHYSQHNDYPVLFCDIGLTDDREVAWCKERGSYVKVEAPDLDGWWLKPFAIMHGEYQQLLFLDADCQCTGDVGPIFDLCAGGGIGIWPTPCERKPGRNWPGTTRLHSSGCMSVLHGSLMVRRWAEYMYEAKQTIYDHLDGDEVGLNRLLSTDYAKQVRPIPEGMTVIPTITCAPPPREYSNTLVKHWGHNAGRVHILNETKELGLGFSASATVKLPAHEGNGWQPEPTRGPSVLVGADGRVEQYLPWWWHHYSQHNSLPVVFLDLGMSAKAREWCKERGDVVPVSVPNLDGWWLKPFAIMRANADMALWLDVDCEVRGDVSPFLDRLENGKLLMRRDEPFDKAFGHQMPVKGPAYNTGTLGVLHGDAMVYKWAQACLAEDLDQWPTDQGLLAGLQPAVTELVIDDVRLRMDGDGACVVFHWTGSAGYEHIAQEMQQRGIDFDPVRSVQAPVWEHPPTVGDSVIVGADSDAEKYLPWFWEHYKATNSIPVVFADFGMSDAARAWCEARGRVVAVAADGLAKHYLKPYAILKANARRAVWLDVDCECRGGLSPILEAITAGGFVARRDPLFDDAAKDELPADVVSYNTGVLGVGHGSKVIERWAAACAADAGSDRAHDQRVLAQLKPAVTPMPDGAVALNHESPGECIVYHWTGPSGKKHIEGAMRQDAKPCRRCGK